ncbi:Crp/Fnr family transcriptional regulator [Nocardioides panacisoli]|uniref:Crp/Fnr family transcriptional regulator n=1 Tax=Nocardioides panacisoli TaxID=627624 RepID=UPI001C62C3FC|nr:Crp/Fnr family transcriptional regulator [Nocardioides panacisoli]QYJ05701.1 Crp/Fnr family transcriptional regulator [Nocardioides panacisoli]
MEDIDDACPTPERVGSMLDVARPWAPGRREEGADVGHAANDPDRTWCLTEVDIFADLDDSEMDRMARSAPMRTYLRGDLIYSPHDPLEALFILKEGRVRIFRVSEDGRALTTAILAPGTIFGEMVVVGQHMHDSFAEALDDVTVCLMGQADVRRFLLADARIAARISETLGRRLGELEQRLSDTVFKSVPERVASTLAALAAAQAPGRLGRPRQVRLTHEQLAALAGTSRETTTKVLGELADAGAVTLGRGRISIVDLDRLRGLGGH